MLWLLGRKNPVLVAELCHMASSYAEASQEVQGVVMQLWKAMSMEGWLHPALPHHPGPMLCAWYKHRPERVVRLPWKKRSASAPVDKRSTSADGGKTREIAHSCPCVCTCLFLSML